MAIQTSNQVVLRAYPETTWGDAPPGVITVYPVRYVSEDLKHVKTTRMSESMRADRQRLYNFETGQDVAGTINTELAPNEWGTLIRGAIGSAAAPLVYTCTITSAAGANTFTRTAGDAIPGAITVGMWIRVSGMAAAANNTAWRVNTVAADVLTVDDPSNVIVTEGPTANVVIQAWSMQSSTTLSSWVFEKYFPDLTAPYYMGFRGCRVNEWNLRAMAREIITSSFGIVGKKGQLSTTGAATGEWFDVAITTPTRSSTYSTAEPITASANVADFEDKATGVITHEATGGIGVCVREFTLALNNNMRAQGRVADKTACGVAPGWHDVTGTLVAYFTNSTLVSEILNHTAVLLRIRMVNSSGAGIIITLPEVYFTGDTPTVGGANQDVMVPLTWVALRDSVLGYTIQVDCLGTTSVTV